MPELSILLKRVHFPDRYSCLISIVIESVLTKPVLSSSPAQEMIDGDSNAGTDRFITVERRFGPLAKLPSRPAADVP
jgi:hypothetical protein